MTAPLLIEILSFEGCPNVDEVRERIRRALEAESRAAEVVDVAVETPEAAQELHFLGSPSVRVNGRDVEPDAANRHSYGLMCRTYRFGSRVDGAPSVDLIRDAVRSEP
ncbi:MAG: hypothetical protein NVSMB57_13120 [Actinomycetota bacterium]